MYLLSAESEFVRECFRDLLADGQPHSLKNIAAHVTDQSQGTAFAGEYSSPKVWQIIIPLTKKADSEYANIRHGIYQKINPELKIFEAAVFDWGNVLNKVIELQGLLAEGFDNDAAIPGLTPEAIHNQIQISKSASASIDTIIDGIAAWIAQMDDQHHDLSVSSSHGMTMSI